MKNISKEDFTGTPALERLGVKVENSVGIYEFIPSLSRATGQQSLSERKCAGRSAG